MKTNKGNAPSALSFFAGIAVGLAIFAVFSVLAGQAQVSGYETKAATSAISSAGNAAPTIISGVTTQSAQAQELIEKRAQEREELIKKRALARAKLIEYRAASSEEKIREAAELRETLSERKEQMLDMAESDPAAFMDATLTKNDLKSIPAELTGLVEAYETLEERTVAVAYFDDFENPENSRIQYVLEGRGLPDMNLYVSNGLEDIAPDSVVTVAGYKLEDSIVANEAQVDVVHEAAFDGASGQESFKALVVLVTYRDSLPPSQSRQQVEEWIRDKVNPNFLEQSYGKFSITEATVLDWYSMPRSISVNGVCSQDNVANIENDDGLGNYVLSKADPALFDIVYVVNNINKENCRSYSKQLYGGWAWLGDKAINVGGKNFTVKLANSNRPLGTPIAMQTFVHETGHTLGVYHANHLACKFAPIGGDDCDHIEYGNLFDMMGFRSSSQHINAYFKNLFGWLENPDYQTISNSGIYTLSPLEHPTGLRGIRVGSLPLILEYRQPIGIDYNLGVATEFNSPTNANGLMVNYIGKNHLQTQILDMSPTNSVTRAEASRQNKWPEFTRDWSEVTLNGNKKFTYGGVTIGPIFKADSNGITFGLCFEASCAFTATVTPPITPSAVPTPTVTRSPPNVGGPAAFTIESPSSLSRGQQYTIKWTSTGIPVTADLSLYHVKNGAKTLIAVTKNTGSYQWSVPTSLSKGFGVSIRIEWNSNRQVFRSTKSIQILSAGSQTSPTSAPSATATTTPTSLPTPTPVPSLTPSQSPARTEIVRPDIKLKSPARGFDLLPGSQIVLSAEATDNVGVSKVDFYVNYAVVCTDTAPDGIMYSCSWQVPSGARSTYRFQARATDASGNYEFSNSVSLRTN